jgi:hypothetical protein
MTTIEYMKLKQKSRFYRALQNAKVVEEENIYSFFS